MNKPTKNQHYVPQVYLKGFSRDEVHVYRNELNGDRIVSSKFVPIESIFREKYLYEIKDSNNSFVALNHVEKCLSALEGMLSTYRNQLMRKAFNKENHRTKCFFTAEEKNFWKIFVVLQMLRSPAVLDVARKFSADYFSDSLSANDAYSIATQMCLPFFKELKSEDENCLTRFLEPVIPMSIVLGVDFSGRIITSDNPVYFYSQDKTIENCEKIVFPVTSQLVLLLLGGKMKEGYDKNRAFELEDDELDSIIKPIAYSADSTIISRDPLTSEIKTMIREARKDKQEDSLREKNK